MKKADWILLGLVLLVALLGYGMLFMHQRREHRQGEAYVKIMVNQVELDRLSLLCDRDYAIPTADGDSILVIRDGCCYMQSAHCPDQVCVRTHAISTYGESIICLPYQIVVTIEGSGEAEYDYK